LSQILKKFLCFICRISCN